MNHIHNICQEKNIIFGGESGAGVEADPGKALKYI